MPCAWERVLKTQAVALSVSSCRSPQSIDMSSIPATNTFRKRLEKFMEEDESQFCKFMKAILFTLPATEMSKETFTKLEEYKVGFAT